MPQTSVIFFGLLIGFVVYITDKGELTRYLGVFGLGKLPSAQPSNIVPNANTSSNSSSVNTGSNSSGINTGSSYSGGSIGGNALIGNSDTIVGGTGGTEGILG
jgi:hypothetical protein